MADDTGEWRLDDAAAEYYETHFVPAIFSTWAPLVVDAADLAPGQRVLDVACGTGIVARAAAERVGEAGGVVGIDLNASMLKVARRLCPAVDWREGDATRLPFADASFDATLSQAGLMFMPDPAAVLREMGRVVRANGIVVVHVFGESEGYECLAEVLEDVAGAEVARIFRAPFAMADARKLLGLLESAGLRSVRLETFARPARFASVDEVVKTEIEAWVLKGRVDVEAVLPAARERLARYVGADGTVALPMKGHIVTSCKR